MHLWSSLEPAGPKSSGHYLVLHYEKRCNLIKLPKSYEDLQKRVETLYHLKSDEFYVETKELNVCAGERVRIPGELWGDIAELLGNVHVVSSAIDAHPESSPESISHSEPVRPQTQGVISLEAPLVKDELVVINLGEIDSSVDLSSTSRFLFRVLDDRKNGGLSITVFPRTGSIFLTSATNDTTMTIPFREAFPAAEEHSIMVTRKGASFVVHFDLQHIGTVEAPSDSALTTISYDLGTQPTFKGFVSANVYSGLSHLREKFQPYRTLYPQIDKETLYQQILIADPLDATQTSRALTHVRQEITTFLHSSPGIKWRCKSIPVNTWCESEWDAKQHSLYIARFTITENPSSTLYFHFGQSMNYSLLVTMPTSHTVTFSEHQSRKQNDYLTIKLTEPINTPGDHSLACINHSGNLYVVFDLKQSLMLPKSTALTRMPRQVKVEFNASQITSITADMYDFDP